MNRPPVGVPLSGDDDGAAPAGAPSHPVAGLPPRPLNAAAAAARPRLGTGRIPPAAVLPATASLRAPAWLSTPAPRAGQAPFASPFPAATAFPDGAATVPPPPGANAAFELLLDVPRVGASAETFLVRLWGPASLFGGSDAAPAASATTAAAAAAIATAAARPTYRLAMFLHGAGMSSACFHLLACAMMGIDPAVAPRRVTVATAQATTAQASTSAAGDSCQSSEPAALPPSATEGEMRLICASFDYRGHGLTPSAHRDAAQAADSAASPLPPKPESQCDLDTLCSDACGVLSRLVDPSCCVFGDGRAPAAGRWAPDGSVFLAGHSLGGAVACAVSERREWRQRLLGLALLDIVEGTALESIRHMPEFLRRRPRCFPSVDDAVAWFTHMGGMRVPAHAWLSVPPLLRRVPVAASLAGAVSTDEVFEWVSDLAATEPHWAGWFSGMDGRFLHAVCPRLLCLSSRDSLDRDLTVAHMQGQFQLEIVRDCGHYLMEDAPDVVARVLLRFIQRVEQQSEKLRALYVRKFGVGPTPGGADVTSS
jgi:pimeloyl-ACP methyl ester carboxylesterase